MLPTGSCPSAAGLLAAAASARGDLPEDLAVVTGLATARALVLGSQQQQQQQAGVALRPTGAPVDVASS